MIDTARAFAPARYNATTEAPPVTGPAQPSAPRAALPTNSKAMGRDEFLKMLVAQLKNQDPLNPMDGKEMAAQLAQFSTVEQLVTMNKSLEAQAAAEADTKAAIESLEKTQTERSDELAQLIEGQMAMGTVGKIGVAAGDTTFVDRAGKGTIVVDTGSLAGTGRITVTDAQGRTVGVASVGQVKPGQQSFELGDYTWEPKLPAGTYKYKFEVATDGGPYQSVKTYTAGRITGMKYDNGNPILLIGDSMQLPMAQLIQLRS
ncbi:MAG: putative flagellar basal-body rod modification protein FlgD [Gemmatimonadota bacterium]|jgi:flagellar basal-body rod modification protein FlgD